MLFHLIVFLSPIFNRCNNLLSSSIKIVTIGTYNSVSGIENGASVGEMSKTAGFPIRSAVTSRFCMLVITQFVGFTSQLGYV